MGGSLYPSLYHATFSPTMLDRLVLRDRIMPPRGIAHGERKPYTILDIGCGDGVALVFAAAANPASMFIGIDAMPEHIAIGRQAARELGVDNVELRCLTFDQTGSLPLAAADYIIAQGVLSWIGPRDRQHLAALVASALAPGGIAAVGYNSLPGWARMLPFQKLLYQLAAGREGEPADRFEAAYEQVRRLSDAGLRTLDKRVFEWIDDLRGRLPRDYFPHEYLVENWAPQWSVDVIAAMERHGLAFARSGRPDRLREDFMLKKAQREEIAGIPDKRTRDLLTDLFIDCHYRTDIYTSAEPATATKDDCRQELLKGYWVLTRPGAEIEYRAHSPAGTLKFDNPATRAIVERLEEGPASLADIPARDGSLAGADLLYGADALFYAGLIVPVEPRDEAIDVERINRWITRDGSGSPRLNALMAPHGPVVLPSRMVGEALEDPGCCRRFGLKPASRAN